MNIKQRLGRIEEALTPGTECDHLVTWFGDDGSGQNITPEPHLPIACPVCGKQPFLLKVKYEHPSTTRTD